MPVTPAKAVNNSSVSRRSASNPSSKTAEVGHEPAHGLSSDGHWHEEANVGEHYETNLEDNQKKLKAFFDQVSKTNPWPGRFVKTVRSRQEAVLKKVEEIREKSVSDKKEFDAEMAPLLSAALGGLTDEPSDSASFSFPMQVRYLGAETQPYCEAMCGLLEQSGALVLAYDELAGRPTHKSRLDLIEASFKDDREATESTVAAGKKVAAFQIERLLTDRYNEVRTPHDLTAEEEHQGKVLLSHGTHENPQSKPTPGWGNVAVDTERAVGRLCFAGEVDDGAR
ncbi:hypothetical protein CLCR_05017 [Cladophialophora carrionii]|uniref:Uncharacterized protein n=1 Tax=Cladophialophora carrionii TaxID=86049 RepID=A0A1C1CJF7_9EURO|nr:hypothetical protein CLCR_05017 [Cladophialophora carrionii]